MLDKTVQQMKFSGQLTYSLKLSIFVSEEDSAFLNCPFPPPDFNTLAIRIKHLKSLLNLISSRVPIRGEKWVRKSHPVLKFEWDFIKLSENEIYCQ